MSVKNNKRFSPRMMPIKLEGISDHSAMVERLRKSLYYGKLKHSDSIEHPSMPLTEVAVKMLDSVSSGNNGLEIFDMYFASSCIRKASASPCSIMMAMIYLERLKRTNPDYLRTVSSCDLFLVSVMIASKFLFDDGEENEVYNDDWAESADIEVKKLNRLEREFLAALDWSCYVNSETFLEQLTRIEALITFNQCHKRGWSELTYNELVTLLNHPSIEKETYEFLVTCLDYIVKITVVASVTYAAAILTLLGASTFVALSSSTLTTIGSSNQVASNVSFPNYVKSALAIGLVNNYEPHLNFTRETGTYDHQKHQIHLSFPNLFRASRSHVSRFLKEQKFPRFFKCKV